MSNLKKIKKNKKTFGQVAEMQLKENMEVIKSLREYDEGKKDISTTKLEEHLPNIRVATGA